VRSKFAIFHFSFSNNRRESSRESQAVSRRRMRISVSTPDIARDFPPF